MTITANDLPAYPVDPNTRRVSNRLAEATRSYGSAASGLGANLEEAVDAFQDVLAEADRLAATRARIRGLAEQNRALRR